MKKIAILYNLNRKEHEYETEFDSEYTIEALYKALSKNYNVIKIEADKEFKWINEIIKVSPDLVFNICEGYNGPARESVYAAILEQLGQNYSGPDSTNMLICHNKYLSKNILKNYIKAPWGYCITKLDDLNNLYNIPYPLIVKLNSEGSSMGMTAKSIVYDKNQLYEQVENLLKTYNRAVLIEQYISGDDISMVYIEGLGALGPCKVTCDSEFYDYEMKSIKDDTVNISTYNCEDEKLKDIVNIIAQKLDLKGYAKLDFRVNQSGIYLIEVNAQVSFHPEGEFMTCVKKEGYDFEFAINYIVKKAIDAGKKINSIGYKE